MPAQYTPIPVYQQPCLATDATDQSFYLVGSPTVNILEVNFVTNPTAATVNLISSQDDPSIWNTDTPKLCYRCTPLGSTNGQIRIFQFGSHVTAGTIANSNYTILPYLPMYNRTFVSTKLFALSGLAHNSETFAVFTNSTQNATSSSWQGVQLDFAEGGYDTYYDPYITYFPSSSPLLAVGTYLPSADNFSHGFTTVFDTDNNGKIYPALVNAVSFNSTLHILTFGSPVDVNMNGIKLTAEAIPVTAASTGYVLDKALDGTTLIYSITPNESATLNRVPQSGNTLRFAANMAASALQSRILTYSVSPSGRPYFNTFDPVTGTWSGDGLISSTFSVNDTTIAKPVLGTIIGGVVGGLLAIAGAIFLFFRLRGQRSQKAAGIEGLGSKQGNQEDGDIASLGDEPQHPDSYIPPPPHPSNSHEPMMFESNSMEPSPHAPHYVSPTSFRESSTTGRSPQYFDRNTPTVQGDDMLYNPQVGSPSPWCDEETSPTIHHSSLRNPQNHLP